MKPRSRRSPEIGPAARSHTDAFVRAFVRRERRERYLSLLLNPGRRPQILDRLNHGLEGDLIGKYVLRQTPREAAGIERSREVYVIADDPRHDDGFVRFEEAVGVLRWLARVGP